MGTYLGLDRLGVGDRGHVVRHGQGLGHGLQRGGPHRVRGVLGVLGQRGHRSEHSCNSHTGLHLMEQTGAITHLASESACFEFLQVKQCKTWYEMGNGATVNDNRGVVK